MKEKVRENSHLLWVTTVLVVNLVFLWGSIVF